MGDPWQILSWRSIFVLSLLLLVFCILCSVIIMNSKLDFRLKKDKVSRVIKKPKRNARLRNVTWHIHKQTICLRSERAENCSCILIFALFLENIDRNCFNVPLFLRLRLCDICKRSCSWFARDLLVIHRVNIISQISSLSWMKHDSAPKIVAWRHKCWVTSRRTPTGSAQYIASNKYAWTKQDCSPLRRRVTRS